MNDPYMRSSRNWSSGQDAFPGLDQPFSGPPAEVVQTSMFAAPVPVQAPQSSSPSIKLPFNINVSNLNDIKGLIDRMGGVEGVLDKVGKFQKFMSTVQQVAPLLKLFKKGASSSDSDDDAPPRRRRRRRTARRRRTTARRRAGSRKRK